MAVRFLVAAALALLVFTPAAADEGDAITLRDAWSRATAPRQTTGAVFLTVANSGDTADRLIAVASPHADKTELHGHTMDGEVMRMRPVEAIEVPAEGTVALRPGGFHVMLIGLATPLAEGDVVPLSLTFERAGTFEVEAEVLGAGARGDGAYAPRDGAEGHGAHGGMPMDGHGGHGGHGGATK